MNRSLPCAWLLVATASLVAGCGDDTGSGGGGVGGGGGGVSADPLESRFTSGARLKVRVQRAGDADQFYGVYDAELDTACTIAEASDGALRCVPSGVSFVAYGDDACTEPVASYYAGGCNDNGPGTYATQSETTDACTYAQTMRVFEVGAELAPGPIFSRDATGACLQAGPESPRYELGAEVEPSTLVELEIVEAARGDALSVSYFHSDDGLYLIGDSPRDTARATACYPGDVGGELRCNPSGLYASSDNFSDAACTEVGVFPGLAEGCSQPGFGTLTMVDGCSYETHVYEVGASLTTTYLELETGDCVESGVPNPFALGAQVPDAELASVELAVEGEGDVRLSGYQAAGLPITRYANFVTGDGSLCYPYPFSEGISRCGPPTIAYVGVDPNRYYADSSCDEPLVPIYDDPCAESEPNLAVVAAGDPNECVFTEGVYEVGAVHNGAVFVNAVIEGCSEVVPAGVSFRQLGARAPDEDFVAVTLETL